MRKLLEILVFGGVALGLHLWVFAMQAPQIGGAEGAGDEGEALLTLVSTSPSIAQMVEQWERPPEVAPTPVLMAPEAVPEAEAPRVSSPAAAPLPVPRAGAGPGLSLPAPDAPKAVDMTPPKPQPKPQPTPKPKPAAQPKPEPKPKPAQPAPKSKPASAGSAGQKAAGSGKTGTAGRSGTQNQAASGAKAQALIARWGASIRNRIERKKHLPGSAAGRGGTVVLRVVVGRDGRLRGVSVLRSSGVGALDQAAVRAVKRAGRFPAAPKGLSQASYTFSLPIRFQR